MLLPGTRAPNFSLRDQYGNTRTLDELRGNWVLLWWYPKASSPGCTIEGQALRDLAEQFKELRANVVGASFDTTEANRQFAQAQGFPFPLLSDPEHVAGRAYEVERPEQDRYSEFPLRYSYLIDPAGVIRHSEDVCDVSTHAEAMLALLRQQQGAASTEDPA